MNFYKESFIIVHKLSREGFIIVYKFSKKLYDNKLSYAVKDLLSLPFPALSILFCFCYTEQKYRF